MSFEEVLKIIKGNKPCKVRFTGNILALTNREFNAENDRGVLQIDMSNINKDDYIKIQQYCLSRDAYTVAGSIIF